MLRKQTAMDLGVLNIGVSETVNSVGRKDLKTPLNENFPKCFTDTGKLKNYQLQLPIDKSVKLLVQPIKRVQYLLKKQLEKVEKKT